MKKTIQLMLIFIFIMTACSPNEEEPSQGLDLPKMIEVNLTLPETAQPGEPVQLMSEVRLEGDAVDEVDEIYYEIWRKGDQEHSLKNDAIPIGQGMYSLEHTFMEDGVYYIVSHTTLGESHNMPRKKIIVGEVSDEELLGDEEESEMNHEHNQDEHSAEAGHNH